MSLQDTNGALKWGNAIIVADDAQLPQWVNRHAMQSAVLQKLLMIEPSAKCSLPVEDLRCFSYAACTRHQGSKLFNKHIPPAIQGFVHIAVWQHIV